jgi:hypothetical protein
MSPMPQNADNLRTASDLRKALFRLNGCQLVNRRNQIFEAIASESGLRARSDRILSVYMEQSLQKPACL